MDIKPHIVIICPTYDYPSPRNVRVKGVLPHLKSQYRLSVIALCAKSKSIEVERSDDETIVRVPYSWISRYVVNKRFSAKKLTGVTLSLSRISSYLLKRFYLFPDPWVIERKRLLAAFSVLNRPDVLVASIMPFSMAEVAFAFNNSSPADKNVPVVLDIGDPLAANVATVVRGGQKKAREYESKILRSADHVLVTNRGTAEHYIEDFGVHPDSITVVPQGAKLPVADDKTKVLPGSFQASQIKLRYAGLFIKDIRDPRLLFSKMKDWQSAVKLTVCGGIDSCFVSGNEHVNFIGWLSEDEIDEFFADADCLLYFDNKRGLQTSGKIYELLATKKPILFLYDNPDSLVMSDCAKYGHIRFVRNEPQAIDNCFATFRDWFAEALFWINDAGGSSYDVSDFSWSNRAEKMAAVFDKLVRASCAD